MEKRKVNNIDYYFLENKKFKTNTLTVFFKETRYNDNFIKRLALPNILIDKTATYNTSLKLKRKMCELYESSFSSRYIVIGGESLLKFSITFLRSKYLDEDITNDCIEMLYELIYNPFLINNEFDNELVNRTKNIFLNSIKKREQSVALKTKEQAIKLLYKDEPIARDYYNHEDINFTNKELYDYYQEMLNTNEMLITFEGDEDISDKLTKFNSNVEYKYNYQKVSLETENKNLVIKKDDTKQNNLYFVYDGFDSSDEASTKNFFFSLMLGGGATSLLFQEVREKHSLAYSIGASFDNDNKIMCIYGGVRLDSLDKTIEIINEQLNRLKTEDLVDLFNDVKEFYLNVIHSSLDSKGYLTQRYSRNWVSGKNTTIEDVINKVNNVTIDDIKEIANKIQNKVMYVIQGDLDDESK